MTEQEGCQLLQDWIEAVLAAHRVPVRVRVRPYRSGYLATVERKVAWYPQMVTDLRRATGARRVEVGFADIYLE